MPRLVVFSGLPGTGKSTLARAVAERIGAAWLRVDTMDQAIWASGTAPQDLRDWTYRVGYGLAADNLKLGLDVVADSVNPWPLTRDAWRDAGLRAGASVLEIEVLCSDPGEHRRRVETRVVDIEGFTPPVWDAVFGRDYQPWDREPLRIETAGRGADACVAEILARL